MSDKDCLLIHLSRIICGNLLRTYWDLFAIDTPEQFDLFIQICVAILAYKLLLTFKSCPIYMHITWRYRTWWFRIRDTNVENWPFSIIAISKHRHISCRPFTKLHRDFFLMRDDKNSHLSSLPWLLQLPGWLIVKIET